MKANRSQSFPIMIQALNSMPTNELKISPESNSSAITVADSNIINNETSTNAFVINSTNNCSKISLQNVEENSMTDENISPITAIATSIDDTDNLENGIILIVESSLNSIVNTATNQLTSQNRNGVEDVEACDKRESQVMEVNSDDARKLIRNDNSSAIMSTSLNCISGVSAEASTSNTAVVGNQSLASSKKNELPQYWEARTDHLGIQVFLYNSDTIFICSK